MLTTLMYNPFTTERTQPMDYNDDQLDTAGAASVHYVDPRVRLLAEARWRLNTGGTRQEWLALGKDNPEALIREGRDWIRAAVAAGIIPSPK